MHRRALLNLLDRYEPFNATDQAALSTIRDFVRSGPNCFLRSNLTGHLTASAWIVDKDYTSTLLIHHRKLDKWIQCGGHADGETDLLAASLKEAREETGLSSLVAETPSIFDLDVHSIPKHDYVPEHLHYDVRYLLQADISEALQPNDREAIDLRWFALNEVAKINNNESITRMVQKTRQWKSK